MLEDDACRKLCSLNSAIAPADISACFVFGKFIMLVRMMSGSGVYRGRQWLLSLLLGLYAVVAAAAPGSAPTKPMPVVASFSILGDMVSEIGGDHVELTTIIGLGGDAHAFEPTPEHARALAQARVLVVNGLGFEAWLPRLVAAADFQGMQIEASRGVEPRKLDGAGADTHGHHGHAGHEGGVDPHAWQSLNNGMLYARNIAAGLAKADPANATEYAARADRYIEEMKKLDTELHQALGLIAPEKRKVVVPHDSLGYFGADYGIEFIPIAGISSQAEPSARDVAAIIDRLREVGGAAVFLEGATNPRLAEQIARETGAQVGGTLYADTLDESDQPAGSYLGMFKWNAGQLIYALRPARG